MTQLVPQRESSPGEILVEVLKVVAPPVLGYLAGQADGKAKGYDSGYRAAYWARQPEVEQLLQQRDQYDRARQQTNAQLQQCISELDRFRVIDQTKDAKIANLETQVASLIRTNEALVQRQWRQAPELPPPNSNTYHPNGLS